MVEQLICNQQVGGSSPLASSKWPRGRSPSVPSSRRTRFTPSDVRPGQANEFTDPIRHSGPARAVVLGARGSLSSFKKQTSAGLWGNGSDQADRGHREILAGEVPKRPNGAGCKPVGASLRRFESSPLHQAAPNSPRTLRRNHAGIAQLARAQAFQAWGRGFEPRFPLQTNHELSIRYSRLWSHTYCRPRSSGG
jgi:hypothetical protein